jgi:hypothetical protein
MDGFMFCFLPAFRAEHSEAAIVSMDENLPFSL